jgi:hypothetical protein
MQVWRKKTVRYVLDGEKVPRETRGAKKETVESKRYYGTLRLGDDSTKQVPLCESWDASRTAAVRDRNPRRVITRVDSLWMGLREVGAGMALLLGFMVSPTGVSVEQVPAGNPPRWSCWSRYHTRCEKPARKGLS